MTKKKRSKKRSVVRGIANPYGLMLLLTLPTALAQNEGTLFDASTAERFLLFAVFVLLVIFIGNGLLKMLRGRSK